MHRHRQQMNRGRLSFGSPFRRWTPLSSKSLASLKPGGVRAKSSADQFGLIIESVGSLILVRKLWWFDIDEEKYGDLGTGI